MTAPARTRRKAPAEDPARTGATREAVRESQRTERRRAGTRSGQRSTAAERAYARRAQRVDLMRRNGSPAQPKPSGFRLRWPKSRASFVLILMTLLVAGVVTTLLLSTQAIADSYRLEQLRQENSGLAEQSEQLQQDVTRNESASVLADRAKALGMVPVGDPAHLVLNPDGSVRVVGEPKKAQAQVSTPPAPPATPQNQPHQPPNQNPPQGQNQPQNPPVQGDQAQPPAGPTAPIEGDVAQGDEQQPPVVSAQGGQ